MSENTPPAGGDTPTPLPQTPAQPTAPTAAYPPPPAGYPPAGQPPQYGAPTPPPAAPDSRPKTLAMVALIIAIVGIVMAVIPFVTWISGLVLLAAFIISLIALISKKHGGKGMSIAALIISVVGWIVSIVMTFVSIALISGAALNQALEEEFGTITEQPMDEDDEVVVPESGALELEVTEVAFGPTSYDENAWWFVVLFENPNEDYIFDYADIDIEAVDANGVILDSYGEYRTVLSGTAAIVGTFYEIGTAEIANLDIYGPTADEALYSPFAETGEFWTEDLAATTDDFSSVVTGVLYGDFDADQELVEVEAVVRDASGQIIGGDWTFVDRLPAGGGAQFEIDFWEIMPADATFEVYASL
ncbi:hypothetical protein GCM10009808_09840 [Microbacterium sediminicola]|uniref:DUF4190 domain-containing protein n=1 Tax=Microbacterium sediminicola TaxID=415210 RepID=A0ABN2HWL7_9MICO